MEKSMKTFMLTQLIIGMVTILVGALMFFPFTLDHQWKESPELYGETINLDLEKFFGKEAVVQGKIITFIEPNSKELVFKKYFALNIVGLIGFVFLFVGVLYLVILGISGGMIVLITRKSHINK